MQVFFFNGVEVIVQRNLAEAGLEVILRVVLGGGGGAGGGGGEIER